MMKYDQIWSFRADTTIKLQSQEIEDLKNKNKKLKEELRVKDDDIKSLVKDKEQLNERFINTFCDTCIESEASEACNKEVFKKNTEIENLQKEIDDLKSDRAFRKLENNYKWTCMLLDDLGIKYKDLKEKNKVLQDKLQNGYIVRSGASSLVYECKKWKKKYIELNQRLYNLVSIDEIMHDNDFQEV